LSHLYETHCLNIFAQGWDVSHLPVSTEKGEIVLYQPDDNIKLEVRLDKETVWLTQQQIADLFGVKQPAILKHIANIYTSGELEESGTYSILEYMGNDGNVETHQWRKPSHDRWLIIDDSLYHCGHSLKDMGRKLSAITLMGISLETILDQVR